MSSTLANSPFVNYNYCCTIYPGAIFRKTRTSKHVLGGRSRTLSPRFVK